MRKLFILSILNILFLAPCNAYVVCGLDVDGLETAYTQLFPQGTILNMANWAVGTGCPGEIDANDTTQTTDIRRMCTNVIAGGHAFCAGQYTYSGTDLNEITASVGAWCWCRRTVMHATRNSNELLDSIGQWVLLGGAYGDTSPCVKNCARLCAENVATNVGNMRNAIMTLPAI